MKSAIQFILCVLFVLNFNVLLAQQNNRYEVTTEILNVRTEPNSNSEILDKLVKSQVVEVVKAVNDWSLVTYQTADGKIIEGYVKSDLIIKQTQKEVVGEAIKEDASKTSSLMYIIIGALALCFVCYIIAMIKARNGTMTVIANWYDFTLLVFPFISLIAIFIGFLVGAQPAFFIVVSIIGSLCLIGSLVYSVVSNSGNIFNIIISIFAKIFVLLILGFSVLFIFRGKKKDNSFYDDMKHDASSVAAVGIAGFLIFSLVGHGQHQDLIEKIKTKI